MKYLLFTIIILFNINISFINCQHNRDTISLTLIETYIDFKSVKSKYLGNIRTNKQPQHYNSKDSNLKNVPEHCTENLNVMIQAPNEEYSLVYYEGEVPSKYILFIDQDGSCFNFYNIGIDPILSFSESGNYLVVYSLYQSVFYIFNNIGQVIYVDSCQNIFKNEILYHISIDNSGRYLLLNTAYKIYLYDLSNNNTIWTKKINSLLIEKTIFDQENNLIFIKSLFSTKQKLQDKYSFEIISFEKGKELFNKNNISEMFIINRNIILKSEKSYYEYKIH